MSSTHRVLISVAGAVVRDGELIDPFDDAWCEDCLVLGETTDLGGRDIAKGDVYLFAYDIAHKGDEASFGDAVRDHDFGPDLPAWRDEFTRARCQYFVMLYEVSFYQCGDGEHDSKCELVGPVDWTALLASIPIANG